MAREDVRHDAVSLFRFVESICSFCGTATESPAYLPASKEFLSSIFELGEKTKEYLTLFHDRLPVDPSDYGVYRQVLTSLRYAWFEVHRRVKPVADADTLHLPSALIQVMIRRLQGLSDFANADFAVFHTEKLNFLQVVATGIRDTISSIASITGAAPLRKELGLIGIPYSQTQSVFLNCLIAHEIAHFVFGEKQIRNDLAPRIMTVLKTQLATAPPSIDPKKLRWLPNIFSDLLEELFCDSFAIRFIGPCYSFAFIEIFDIGNVVNQSGSIRTGSLPSFEFSESHPADLYRIKRHAELLDQTGWLKQIEKSPSLHVKLLKQAKLLPDSSFTFPLYQSWEKDILQAFFSLIPEVEKFAGDILATMDNGLKEYRELADAVSKLLLHGVVPSSIVDSTTGDTKVPNPVTVLNVAFIAYLDRVADLMNKIQNQDIDAVRDRARWTEKLEMWTLKALEDHELLTQAASI
jgi:hypothetical protein